MCYSIKIRKKDLEDWMSRHPGETPMLSYIHQLSGFTHPELPLLFPKNEIRIAQWGLLPSWAKDRSLQKNTLNAKIETLHEKPSFKSSIQNRCIVRVDGFYEWQWSDVNNPKCRKQMYFIKPKNGELSLGSIYSDWVDRSTGEVIRTFSIVTTEANEFMAEIHNSKKRMPVTLNGQLETDWLEGREITDFAKPTTELEAEMII